MMGGGSIFQERTDKLVKELLDKIRRENYSEEEKQPQEFDKESIREFLLNEIAALKENGATQKEIEEKKRKVVEETELIYGMCKGDQLYYFEERDLRRKKQAEKQNQFTIFLLCLGAELNQLGLSNVKRENLKKERIAQFNNGVKVYTEGVLIAAEQAQIQMDKQMPTEMRKLIDISKVPTTYEIIKEINDRRNAFIDQPIKSLKQPK